MNDNIDRDEDDDFGDMLESDDEEGNNDEANGANNNNNNNPSPTKSLPAEQEDPAMVLTGTERLWALEVKRAVMEDDELQPLTDFEYVKHALVAEGNIEEALFRIERMQEFREHYKINQSTEQGMEILWGLMQQQPGFLLHIDVDPVKHTSINVIDLGMFDPHVALAMSPNGKENWPTFICGLYYMKYSSQPTFANIRNGFYALADFGDINNFNFKPEAQQRIFDEVLRCYPYTWRQFLCYNTGYVANVKMGLAKALMSEKMRRVVQLGCVIEESEETRNPTQRLRDFYLQPSLEEAYQHILIKVHSLIERRNHNQRIFRL